MKRPCPKLSAAQLRRLRTALAQADALLGALGPAVELRLQPASVQIRKKAPPGQVLHALCHLGKLALKAQVATVEEILGDKGIVHEWGHELDPDLAETRRPGWLRGYIRAVLEIERRLERHR